MMSNFQPTLAERIGRSSAVKSLRSEREVVDSLRRNGWHTTHGLYYDDLKAHKWRELDVYAQLTGKRHFISGDRRVTLALLIERKSVPDYHIVFSPSGVVSCHCHSSWLGYEETVRELFPPMLSRVSLPGEAASSIVEKTHQLAYPRYLSRVAGLLLRPPSAPLSASAFRETNTKTERDVASSVMWKAGLSLESAMLTLSRMALESQVEEIEIGIRADRGAGDLTAKGVEDLIRSYLDHADVFHPILIIESTLWLIDGSELKPIDWCRFYRHSTSWNRWWFDIVRSEFFAEYSDGLTKHYLDGFRKAKCQLLNRRGEPV